MPSVYQTVFGGNVVAPALPTFLSLPITANVVLGWPLESNITAPAAAEIIEVTASIGGLTVQLSDARQVSTGYCALFNNIGANTFSVLDAQGNTLAALTSGQVWQIYLADNSTLQGTWRVFQYGAGVSNANAAALAGNGLKAIATTLNERIVINPQAVNYAILNTDRAACIEWTGGAGGTFTPPAPAVVGSDWFCYIKNSGTAVLTLSGTIDGSAGKTFNPNDSCILISDGTNLFTMGFGQSVASSFNFVTISLAGASGTVILTGAQLNRISYKFTGALTGNTIVQVPASIQQYWVDNETTGAFTLTISAGGAGSTFVVPQATRVILYCDGLNIVNAISSGAIQFADGTAAAPSITFASDTALGFYKVGADVLGITTAGNQRITVNASGNVTINSPSSGTTLNINGASGQYAVHVVGVGAAGNNYGVNIAAGANAADSAVLVTNAAASATFFQVFGDGHGVLGPSGGVTGLAWSATGNVTVEPPSAGVALTVSGFANSETITVTGSSTTGQSFGVLINAGTTSADFGFVVNNQAGTVGFVSVRGDGQIALTPTAATGVTINTAGTVTISKPSAGNALTVTSNTGAGGFYSSSVNGNANTTMDLTNSSTGAAANAYIRLQNSADAAAYGIASTGNTAHFFTGDPGVEMVFLGTAANIPITIGTNGIERIRVAAAGNVTMNAPASGRTVTISGFNGTHSTQISDSATNLYDAGYLDLPQTAPAGSYQLVISDRGKSIYVTGAAATVTIPANATVAFPVGTTIVIVNNSGGNVSIAITTDQMVLAGTSTTGTRTLASNGIATIYKYVATGWFISGTGVT